MAAPYALLPGPGPCASLLWLFIHILSKYLFNNCEKYVKTRTRIQGLAGVAGVTKISPDDSNDSKGPNENHGGSEEQAGRRLPFLSYSSVSTSTPAQPPCHQPVITGSSRNDALKTFLDSALFTQACSRWNDALKTLLDSALFTQTCSSWNDALKTLLDHALFTQTCRAPASLLEQKPTCQIIPTVLLPPLPHWLSHPSGLVHAAGQLPLQATLFPCIYLANFLISFNSFTFSMGPFSAVDSSPHSRPISHVSIPCLLLQYIPYWLIPFTHSCVSPLLE
ncbi:uncharacterized protein LOC134810808 [Pan troglodytes]|uniref:uncharacterized protein LOC134810808 n=1 Tax=Pan troglodytes TaxID=9598 RepID=UPI003013DF24